MLVASPIHQILDLARWAPSGDNTQPWRFEIVDELHFVIHGRDTREDTVYDLDGRPSQISLGALIETAAIAASAHGLALQVLRRLDMPEERPTFDVTLLPHAHDQSRSPLVGVIPERRVQRRPMSTRPLTPQERSALEEAVGPDFEVLWFSGWAERIRWAKMLWTTAGLRLRLPEAFEVHKRVIQWSSRFSPDRLPDQALGVDKLTIAMMRWAMASWSRIDFLNTWLGGTIAPRIQMDLIPALACAAHVAIVSRRPLATLDDYVAGGRAVQRFWLTATGLGLQHQPAVTPLVFSRYVRDDLEFAPDQQLQARALRLKAQLSSLLGARSARAVWLGRLGHGLPATARSERKALAAMLTGSLRGK